MDGEINFLNLSSFLKHGNFPVLIGLWTFIHLITICQLSVEYQFSTRQFNFFLVNNTWIDVTAVRVRQLNGWATVKEAFFALAWSKNRILEASSLASAKNRKRSCSIFIVAPHYCFSRRFSSPWHRADDNQTKICIFYYFSSSNIAWYQPARMMSAFCLNSEARSVSSLDFEKKYTFRLSQARVNN